MRRERLAIAALILILVGLPLITLGYQRMLRPALSGVRVIDIRAAVPESGGFQPDSIRVAAGEIVTLRFHSVDVVHGIAIGPGLGIDLGHVDPGRVAEITVTFPEAGTYTFYCNTWCSDDHWRMRGVIEVHEPGSPGAPPAARPDPVIEALIAEGVDIDAVHNAGGHGSDDGNAASPYGEGFAPSVQRGASLVERLDVPPDLLDADWRFTHTPSEALERLAEANPAASRPDLADAVAHLWVGAYSPGALAAAADLYDKNCAACHGQAGGGDGPAAGTAAETPVAFADAAHMFEMRGDVLYAKTRRGGMGTGMPNYGTLFTQDETRALVDYLWVLAFGAESLPR